MSFFRLTERFEGELSVHFVDHPTTRLYRIRPGLYKFQVQACRRDAAGYPHCGAKSQMLSLTVTDAVEDKQTDPPEGPKEPPGEVASPAGFTPGRWHNPAREGHGWSFYWRNGLGHPQGHAFYGNAWDLVGIWYTYEAKQRFPQNPEYCPEGLGTQCEWVYEEYRPIYAQLVFTQITASQALGSVYIRRSGANVNAGSVSVDFQGVGHATIDWNAHFAFQNIEGVDAIEMLVGPDPDPVDNPAHYSGLWDSPGGDYFVAHGLGLYSESVEVLFDDPYGDPTWILAAGNDPVPESTDLCFFYVAEGFAPGTTGNLVIHEDGCDPEYPIPPTNPNGAREFSGFETESFWADVQLPGGSAPAGFSAGSAGNPETLTKAVSFHRISYDSPSGSSCDTEGGTVPCALELTWFTDGNYAQASAFAFETTGGQRTRIDTATVTENYAWETTQAGEYIFELRMGSTPDTSLMGVSEVFTVLGEVNLPPAEAEPESPPPPAGPPNLVPTVATSQTGAAEGQFAVSPTGSATYRLPVQVAPGAGGLAPTVALVYDSQAGNGPVGVGWQIDGFSVISRCAQTIEQDGSPEIQRITFSVLDRFCLDGERLMAVDGSYGAHGTEYRKEIDDYTRVISYGGGAEGPQYFRAWSRDGVVVELGGTPDSRIETRVPGIENVAYAWAQNRLEDTAGNYMLYQYAERGAGPVDFVLDKIFYTGNVHAGTQPYAELRFVYSDGRLDKGLAYMDGVAATHSRLLKRIDSLSRVEPGAPLQHLRAYFLDHGTDGWGRAALESISECRDPSAAICFPATEFTWQKSEHVIGGEGEEASELFGHKFRSLALGDTSGDGLADLLITELDGEGFEFEIAEGSASGAFTPGTDRFPLPEGDEPQRPVALTVIDLNADGYQDVVYVRRTDGEVSWYARLAGPGGMGNEFLILENCCNLLSPLLLQVMDFNGDGLSDIMTNRSLFIHQEASELVVLINDFEPGDTLPSFRAPHVIDVNYHDLFPAMTVNGWEVTDEIPAIAFQSAGTALGGVDDFYGDGTADILVRLSRGYTRCMYSPCQPDAPKPPEPPQESLFNLGESQQTLADGFRGPDPAQEFARVTFYLVFFADDEGHYSSYEIVATGSGDDCGVPDICNLYWEYPEVVRTLPADINADGLADIAYLDDTQTWHYRLNTGETFLAPQFVGELPDKERAERARFIDINGDRYPELIYPDLIDSDNAVWKVFYNDLGQGYSTSLSSSMPAGNVLQGDVSIMLDFTGDGMVDQLFADWGPDGIAVPDRTRLLRGVNWLTGQSEQAMNVVTVIENGLGARTEVDYLPLTNPDVHTRMNDSANVHWGNGSVVYDLAVPYYVVSSVLNSAPTFASPYSTSERVYHYVGAKMQAGGRGFLGFAEVAEWDAQNRLRTNTRYRQDFPFSGQISDTSVFVSNAQHKLDIITDISHIQPIEWSAVGPLSSFHSHDAHGTLIRYSIHEYTYAETWPAAGARSVLLPAELTRQYTLTGQFRDKTLTVRTFDALGNIATAEERAYAQDGTIPWSVVATENTWLNDLLKWRLGQLESTRVAHWRADAESAIVRRSSYGYHPVSDLLTRETAEPGHPTRQVTTDYTLDVFGNRVTTEITGIGMSSRQTSMTYDAWGRFAVESRNAYGQPTVRIDKWDVFGNQTETRNIDDMVKINAVDHMGRLFGTYTQTGAWQRTDLDLGGHAQCPLGTAYHSVTGAGGAPISIGCHDVLGREIRIASEGFLGSWIRNDSYFDRSGRPDRVSEPYWEDDKRYWNTTEYDALGRVTRTTSANGLVEVKYYDFAAAHCGETGERTVLTRSYPGDATIRDRWELKNVAGETVRVLDDQCGEVAYGYDAVGNLVETTGIDGTVITIDYDPFGLHKVQMDDPDKGLWQYASNALGEVTRQIDGKGQAIDFKYDLMGRVTHRRELSDVGSLSDTFYVTENHEIRTWQNSTSPGVTGRGQLSSEKYHAGESGAVLHRREYVYDAFGRVAQVDHVLEGAPFTESTTYDEFGRVFQRFDASGDFRGIRFVYNDRGYVQAVREAREGQSGTVYQTIEAMGPRGNPVAMTLGNGAELFAEYDPASGYVQTLEAYDAAGQQMQFVEYQFNRLGNLKWREDRSGSNDLREYFKYDFLDRLERVLLTAPQQGLNLEETHSMVYDAAGNITFKSGVGAYSYGAGMVGPHAVTRAGSITYQYDANGNQVSSSDGRAITYSVFDKPTRIQKGDEYTEFGYGIGNRRYKRVDDNPVDNQKTTWTVGSAEWIEESASAYFKRYIGGVAIVDFYPASAVTDSWYLAKDHLGSIHSISNSAGEKVQESHFGPWGARQKSDWQSPLTGGALIAANTFTIRGFTGHEHADALGVIHMNGRIYDPRLGRFLQADPFVQAPKNGQSLNRYSYALNNPLSYTDPSGYFLKRLIRKWGRVIVAAVAAYFTWGASYGWAANAIASTAGNAGFVANLVGAFGWQPLAGVTAGAASGLVAGAILTGSLRGAVKSAFAGAITGGIVGHFGDTYNASRVTADTAAGGINAELFDSDLKQGLMVAALTSLATYVNVRVRAYQVRKSSEFPAQIGNSSGYRGVSGKIAGERIFENIWKESGAASAYSKGASLEEVFEIYRKARLKKGPVSPLGCFQFSTGCVFGIEYKPNGLIDYVLEGYAGIHDGLNSLWFYNANGTNAWRSNILVKSIGRIFNVSNVVLATPIVVPSLVPDYMRHLYFAGQDS